MVVMIAIQLAIELLLGSAFRADPSFLGAAVFLELFLVVLLIGMDFWKRRVFYNEMYHRLHELDQKYLIMEMIDRPGFAEGDILCDVLRDVGKSMNDHVGEREQSVRDFKDYVEIWIHEIKLPLSAISLMSYNGKAGGSAYAAQVEKLSGYVEQILYYVRADAPEKDFLMKKCQVEQMVNEVLLSHKELLIAARFTIEKENTDVSVVSDAKWVKFMLGQIISNSVKYRRGDSGYLKFSVREDAGMTLLTVEDHGIGVPQEDVERVFDKSFTGQNGRREAASTGMGLYICRRMCDKLGHKIWLESEEERFTRVVIGFGRNDYYLESGGCDRE